MFIVCVLFCDSIHLIRLFTPLQSFRVVAVCRQTCCVSVYFFLASTYTLILRTKNDLLTAAAVCVYVVV